MKQKVLKTSVTAALLILHALLQSAVSQQVAERLTIENCYTMAERNYPLIRQFSLIERTAGLSSDNAGKGVLPQIFIAGQASYQSDVTRVPLDIPSNIRIIDISKDQYRLYGEVNQSITDLFTAGDKQALVKGNALAEENKTKAEIYKLKERINQLYFGILLLDAQTVQNEILMRDLKSGVDRAKTAEENGVAVKSSADMLNAELLKAGQRATELRSLRRSHSEALSLFIGMKVEEVTVLERPPVPEINDEIRRPELKMFEAGKKALDYESEVISNFTLPKFSLFIQAGIGRPALNMLSNDLQGYYFGGLRLSWNLAAFYTNSNERQILKLNKLSLDVQRDVFLLNTELQLKHQKEEISKLNELIKTDSEIIELREKVKHTAGYQLEYGTITAIDFLAFVNAEDQARQNRILHDIQLLSAMYNYRIISGN